MLVILSNQLEDNFSRFKVIQSLKELETLGEVECLVIHRYAGDDFLLGISLSKYLDTTIERVVYINDNPSMTIKSLVNGAGGRVYEDEFYLEDEEELLALLEEDDCSENTSLTASNGQLAVQFIDAYINGDEKLNVPAYIEQARDAVTALVEGSKELETQLRDVSTNSLVVFEKAGEIIRGLRDANKDIESKLDALQSVATSASQGVAFANSVTMFPTYRHTTVSNSVVLFIRELSPCRYLTSFALAYQNYLRYGKGKKVKLIFVHQKGQGVSDKYREFTSITQESMALSSLYDNPIIATNNPKKEVMRDLLVKPVDVFIIVDRMYGVHDIVSGRVVKINAVSGRSDLKRYKVDAKDTIFSVTNQIDSLFTIPTLAKYPEGTESRYAIYNQMFKTFYAKLDAMIGLGK